MLFNSLEFLLFLPTIFILYWFVFNRDLKTQNFLILLSSYLFYGWWDYRFLGLIFLSTIVDYFIGLNIDKQLSRKIQKQLLWLSIVFNLTILGFFKYYNFFVESWVDLFSALGYQFKNLWTLKIVLPVGISFYTFQTMSYTIDVYKKKLKPTEDFISFASFVAFFPQLVAGPIERATNLLPQILNKRVFNYDQASLGLKLILWGMLKKVVVADSLSPIVDDIFTNYNDLGGGVLWLGAIFFAFQIYCDFSGYSDIAIGTAKIFGFNLMTNFNFPYFSRNIGEFWRRWHISLSTWFRDYLYIPLGGSKGGKWQTIRNVFIIFLVSGFWHGANWTFIFWGLFHAILFLPSLLSNTNRKYINSVIGENGHFPSLRELTQVVVTFLFVTLGWIIFRSETIGDAVSYINRSFILSNSEHYNPYNNLSSYNYLYVIFVLLGLEYLQTKEIKLNRAKSIFLLVILALMILYLIPIALNGDFIYFQF